MPDWTGLDINSALTPLIATFAVFLAPVPVYAVRSFLGRAKRAELAMGGRRQESRLIAAWAVEYWYWVISPVERLFVRTRLSANYITVASVFVSLGAGWLLGTGAFGWGGWLIIWSGTLDILDGRVARALGTSSKAGAFLDSSLDRYADLLVLMGLVYYYRGSDLMLLPLAVTLGTILTSYVRARGEGLGVSFREGLMQRAERLVMIGLGTALAPFVAAHYEPGAAAPLFHLTVGVLGLLAVLTNVTAVHRIFAIYAKLAEPTSADNQSPPAATPMSASR